MRTPGTLRTIGAIIALSAAGFLQGCAVNARLGPGGEERDILRASVSVMRDADETTVEKPRKIQSSFEPVGKQAAPPSLPVLENEVHQDNQTLKQLEQRVDSLAESVAPALISAERELDAFAAPETKQEVKRLLNSNTVQDFLKKSGALTPEQKALAFLGLCACLIVLIRLRARRAQREEAARLLALQRRLETVQLETSAALAATMQQAMHVVRESQAHFTAMSEAFAAQLDRALAESRGQEHKFEEALHDINALLALAHPQTEQQARALSQAIVARILRARNRT